MTDRSLPGHMLEAGHEAGGPGRATSRSSAKPVPGAGPRQAGNCRYSRTWKSSATRSSAFAWGLSWLMKRRWILRMKESLLFRPGKRGEFPECPVSQLLPLRGHWDIPKTVRTHLLWLPVTVRQGGLTHSPSFIEKKKKNWAINKKELGVWPFKNLCCSPEPLPAYCLRGTRDPCVLRVLRESALQSSTVSKTLKVQTAILRPQQGPRGPASTPPSVTEANPASGPKSSC